ncbi:hypothetical protein KUTeg_020895 [Tegillarca granosa]|uniref:ATPase AAA-type core domain-containing protein n=1 Tax=Tegillarca granosa TaxID=220873 RepID=A0ABQ9E999_TEGGR|nr:hypothetical protein KUTeg_020895 [Tegillarca granosa]
MDSLYEELVMNGIIKRCPNVKLSDYEGEYSYLGTTLRQANIEPMPSLRSSAVHDKAPLTKSVILAGPRGTGKKMLLHTICNETGANLFDLTPANIQGLYPGKDGLKMLIHLVLKDIKDMKK